MEYGDNPKPSQRKGDTFTHSTRFEIALDMATGLCVGVKHLDGSESGEAFDVQIVNVDAQMSDSLFT